MCKERRPRATAQRCACRQLGNAIEGRRSQSPQMPARCHQRSPRRPVRRLPRGCEGRLLNARAPNLRLRRRPCRAPSTLGTFDETRKHDRTCRIEDVGCVPVRRPVSRRTEAGRRAGGSLPKHVTPGVQRPRASAPRCCDLLTMFLSVFRAYRWYCCTSASEALAGPAILRALVVLGQWRGTTEKSAS